MPATTSLAGEPIRAGEPTRAAAPELSRPATGARRTHRERPPRRVLNRVRVLLVHIPKFSIRGQARLAEEVGVSRSTISRLATGRTAPSYALAQAVTAALGRRLGAPLDVREVFTTDGTYPTASGCALCRCGGCLPDEAYDREGDMRSEWRGQRPGDWSLARPMAQAADQGNNAGHGSGAANGRGAK